MKKFFYKLTLIIILIGLFYSLKYLSPSKKSSSILYNEYKLETSGAGESMDAWAFERSYPNGKISPAKYLREFKTAHQNRVSLRSGDDCWESMGPKNIAGRTLCLAFHPQNPDIIFAGSASAGLWKTTSQAVGEDAWEHVPTDFPVLGVGAILIDPTDPDIMYIGTGETYHSFGLAEPGIVNRFTRGTYGIGILKTIDGGNTWEQILSFDAPDLIGIQDMAMSEQNSNEIYAATTQGLYQSLDGGDSWTIIHPVGPSIDVEIDPTNDSIIYVTQGNLNLNLVPELVGLFKSTDKGATFTELLDDGLLPAWSGTAKLSILPDDPNTIYASIQVGWGNRGATTPAGLYKSTDAGDNWTLVNNTNVAFWQGWYSHDIAINPSDPNEIIYVGLDAWRSTDGGVGLTKISDWTKWDFGKIPVDVPEGPPDYVHGDIHAAYYHPMDHNKVFLATDGGVFMSADRGQTYTTLNGGLQTLQLYPNFSTSTTDPNFAIGGAQDNSTWIYDGTPSWSRDIGGDGMSAAINPDDDNIVYASAQGLFLARSDNRADSFFLISPQAAMNEATAFAAPYEIASASSNIVYAGRQFLYRTEDYGDTWQATSVNTVDGSNVIITIAISDLDAGKLYVATSPDPFNAQQAPRVLKSLDAGQSWTDVSTNLPQRIVKDIAIDPIDDDIVYTVFSGFGTSHFAKSVNGGTTWNFNNALPDVPTNTVLIDPLNTDHIYIGNDLGIYFSDDGGDTWEDFSHGLNDATMVAHLSLSPANRKIRVATHGRGIYQRDLNHQIMTATRSEDDFPFAINLYPNPVQDELTIDIESDKTANIELTLLSISGQTILNLGNKNISIGHNKITHNLSPIPAGEYLLQIKSKHKKTTQKLLKMK